MPDNSPDDSLSTTDVRHAVRVSHRAYITEFADRWWSVLVELDESGHEIPSTRIVKESLKCDSDIPEP